MDSILTSIKKMLGIDEYEEHFDPDIIMHINLALATLTQMGAGPVEGFAIVDETSVWSDFSADTVILGFMKSYIYLKVKLIFDPPLSSAAIESMNKMIGEFEWRLFVAAESIVTPEEVEIV
ncbi:hypothetical protein EOM81_10225 [bacterium]|nr:hypothetical protein [bacterium]